MCIFLLQNGALWDMGLVYCGFVQKVIIKDASRPTNDKLLLKESVVLFHQ